MKGCQEKNQNNSNISVTTQDTHIVVVEH